MTGKRNNAFVLSFCSVTERENCLSLAAQIVHLHPVLEEEFKTREQLQTVAAELKRLKKDIAQDTRYRSFQLEQTMFEEKIYGLQYTSNYDLGVISRVLPGPLQRN